MNSASPRPPAVAWLGYGGLLPFVGMALACFLEPHHQGLWLQMLLAYGAVILSFVGALHWGFAMTHPATTGQGASGVYIWSIVPSLVGWVAMLVPAPFGATLLIAGFLTHYRQDVRLARLLQLPPWYFSLRLQLTGVACLCLASVYFLEQALPGAALNA